MENSRKTGDRIPGNLIRQLRHGEKLTQTEMAQRLGVKGGKGVISQWERDGCEGPAAELILYLFGGAAEQARMADLVDSANTEWGSGYPTYYQVTASLHGATPFGAREFADLFPRAALPDDQRRFGFPFVEGLPVTVMGLGANGWTGRIPVEPNYTPAYYWRFTRDCRFLMREKAWEVDSLSSTQGHVHVGSLLEQAACLVYFVRRLSTQLELGTASAWSLGVEVGGVRGRGIVDGPAARIPVTPTRVAFDEQIGAPVVASGDQIRNSPMSLVYDLVAETVLPLRPDLANAAALRRELGYRLKMDKTIRGLDRYLVFLDDVDL